MDYFFKNNRLKWQYHQFRGLNFKSAMDYNGFFLVSIIHYNRLESIGARCGKVYGAVIT